MCIRCSFGGVAGLLEKRDFFERLQELRDRSRDLQNGTVAPPKVVAAPTPNVPSAKDVMPIDPNWTGVFVSLPLQLAVFAYCNPLVCLLFK